MKYIMITVLFLALSYIVNAQSIGKNFIPPALVMPHTILSPPPLQFQGYPKSSLKMEQAPTDATALKPAVAPKPGNIPCLVPDMSAVAKIPTFSLMNILPVLIPNSLIK